MRDTFSRQRHMMKTWGPSCTNAFGLALLKFPNLSVMIKMHPLLHGMCGCLLRLKLVHLLKHLKDSDILGW